MNLCHYPLYRNGSREAVHQDRCGPRFAFRRFRLLCNVYGRSRGAPLLAVRWSLQKRPKGEVMKCCINIVSWLHEAAVPPSLVIPSYFAEVTAPMTAACAVLVRGCAAPLCRFSFTSRPFVCAAMLPYYSVFSSGAQLVVTVMFYC